MFKLRNPKFNMWSLLIALFPVSYLMYIRIRGLTFLTNYDEIVSAFCLVVVLLLLICNKLSDYDTYICVLLTVITAIGVVSNVFSDLITDWFPIVIDVLWLWKPFAVYLFFKYISLRHGQKEKILIELSDASKFVVLFVTVICAIGQVVDIGVMSPHDKVFGVLRQYNFFWYNGIQTGWLLIVALMVLSVTIDEKLFFRYFLISCFPLICTGSSMVFCWVALMLIFKYMLGGKYKFKFWHLLVLAPIIIFVNYDDFRQYFIEESVRKTFFDKGIDVANSYFPFGSGFATYGSEMARRYYSQLYIDWGWENDWAFGRDSGYLNDTYFASILGQFGWIAFILYLICVAFLFVQANNKLLNRQERAVTLSTALTLAITMIGSATAKSMMGICVFAVLGVICGTEQKQYTGIRLRG